MNNVQLSRLVSFFGGMGDKSALIIYLLTKLSPQQIKNLSAEELADQKSGITVIDALIDNHLINTEEGKACFGFAGGRSYSTRDIENILIRAHARSDKEYISIPAFRAFIEAGQ